MDAQHDNSASGTNISFWIWTLTGCAIAGCTLILALVTGHLLRCEDITQNAHDQRRQLDSITDTLHRPIRALERTYGSFFKPHAGNRPAAPHELTWSLAPDATAGLPTTVQLQLQALRDELAQAAEAVESCRQWHSRLGQLVEARQASKLHAETTLQDLQQRVHELLSARSGEAESRRRTLEDALHQIDKQILRVAEEQSERRVHKLHAHELPSTLDFLDTTVSELRVEVGDAVTSELQSTLATLRLALLGKAGRSPPEVARTGFVATHRAWLLRTARGAELDADLAWRLRKLRTARSNLDQLMGHALVAAHRDVQDRVHDLWVTCLVIAAIVGALFMILATSVSRRASDRIRDLTRGRDEAKASAQAQARFLASMSHEIRTPMNGVLGMAEILESSSLTDEDNQLARTIRSSAEALLTVINDILDFSKIEAGKLELDESDFDLRNTVDDTLDLLRHLAADRGNELLYFVDHDVPRFVRGDAGRLRQILLNLTGNAAKFTQDGEITILVDLLGEHRDLVRLQFTVRDTGVGIPHEQQPKLFKTFSQAGDATTRSGGTGLGLTICKRLVQLMGGDIAFQSQPGVGSTFSFSIRLHRAHNKTPTETPADFSGRSALIVDDHETNRELLAMRLATWKMGFDVAEDAEQALELLATAQRAGHPFDLCLLDFQMLGMDGLELAQHIADDPDLAPTRRLLLSSTGGLPEGRTLEECSVDAWISKPLREGPFKDCVSSLLGLAPLTAATQSEQAAAEEPLNAHILVAEDNTINQRVLREMLRRLSCTIEFADNGAAAVEHVRDGHYDLVLMDCQMPVMDGFEATRAIRELPDREDLPIIALTANVLPEDRRACSDAGMSDFLSKPVRQEQLREALVRWTQEAGANAK